MGQHADRDVSPHAVVSSEARLGRGVRIGPFTVVHDNVVLEDGVEVGSHCEIGHPAATRRDDPLVVGRDALIRSHSVLYEGSRFGPGLRTGHGVMAREGIVAGTNLQIGSLGDFQGDQRIGDYVRTQSNVLIAARSELGSFVWIYPHTVFTNDPTPPSGVWDGPVVEDHAVIASNCCLVAGVRIGARSLVAAQSLVRSDVPPDRVFAGVPARDRGPTSDVRFKVGPRTGEPAYPWMRHYRDPYPPDVTATWGEEYGS